MPTTGDMIPKGSSTCKLYLIDSKCDIVSLAKTVVEPEMVGHEYLNLPDFAWLIINETTDEHVLFDLALRKDWENSTPVIAEILRTVIPGIKIESDVPTVLKENGIDLSTITTVVMSHWHFDHTGDLSLFPSSTKVIFGPDWIQNFGTFYPENPDSPYHAAEFEGRKVIELDATKFDKDVAGFKAFDLFNNGSLYILHSPGHTAEHLTALVRTTTGIGGASDTFVVLGADSCHFPGALRPTASNPLPESFTSTDLTDFGKTVDLPCPCTIWTSQHGRTKDTQEARQTPFYQPSRSGGYFLDHDQAVENIRRLQKLDECDNVLLTIAHDPNLRGVLPDLTSGKCINDWKQRQFKEKTMWRLLRELPQDGQSKMPRLVDGQYCNGSKIRDFLNVAEE